MSNLCYYSLYYFSLLLLYYLNIIIIKYIADSKFTFRISIKWIPFIFLVNVASCYLDFIDLVLVKNVLVIVSTVILLLFEYKIKFKRVLICYLITFIVAVVFELLLGFILGIVLNVNNTSSLNFLLIRLLTNVYYYLFFLNILKYVKHHKYILNMNLSLKIVLGVLVLLIIVGTNNYLIINNNNIRIYFLFWGLLSFIVFAMYFIFQLVVNDNNKRIEIRNLKSKNSEVVKYIDEFKTYKHNLKYDLLAIKEKGNEEVNKQIDNLLNSNNNDLVYINSFKEVPSCLIHVFSNCLTITNDNDININIRNNYADKELRINQKDYLKLNEIVGNCLTNAIEALPSNNGILIVDFYEHDDTQFIKIINNYENDIDFDKLGCKYYSTKNRCSGFGLNSIFSNNSIVVNGQIVNDYFVINIRIPK